jgi:hypothetical protein
MGAVAQRAEPGDVIGVQVGIDGLDQLDVELTDELEIALHLVEHRVDDQRLAAAPAGEQIGVGARYGIEKLAEDHGRDFTANRQCAKPHLWDFRISRGCNPPGDRNWRITLRSSALRAWDRTGRRGAAPRSAMGLMRERLLQYAGAIAK